MNKEALDKTLALEKLEDLKVTLQSYGSVLVAYSGGVDSAFLLKVAFDQLGEKAIALTAKSQSLPQSELEDARSLAKTIGVKHIIVNSNEVSNPLYRENPENRCYYCKTELYGICKERATKLGLSTVADGFNADDGQDYRRKSVV